DRPSGPAVALVALVARRNRALAAGDPRALAATSLGRQRALDRATARRARGLGLGGVVSQVHVALAGDTATLRLLTTYGLRGAPGRFQSPDTLRARRTPQGWRVVAARRPARHRPLW